MRWLAFVMLAAGAADTALAQNYPARPVRMIVPWPAGGQTDVITRAVAEAMREALGQQIIVDNRGGAAGRIGTELGARAPADGYTITVANGASHIIAMAIDRKPLYDSVRDFAPVVTLAEIPGVLAVHPGVPVRSVSDLVALAKAQPGRVNYATAGAGSGGHLLGVRLASVAGVTLNHIPYKGEAPAITDAIGGQVQVIVASTLKPQIDAGQLRAIATLGKSRFVQLPELPTLIELGYKELWLITWAGLTVPARTPVAVVAKLNLAANTALAAPRVRKLLADNGYTPVGGPPEVLGEFIRTEIGRYRKVIADFNLTFD